MLEGLLIGFVLALVVLLAAKFVRKADRELEPEMTPEEAAQQLTEHDREEYIQNYSGADVPFSFSDDINGTATELSVNYVEAYGVKYSTIDAAIKSCKQINADMAFDMKQFEYEMAIVRNEVLNNNRYVQKKEMLDEEIYVYEPCKIKIDVPGQDTARIAIDIVRYNNPENGDDTPPHLSMMIEHIYVSKRDVTNKADRYEFDMLDDDDIESFELLVRNSSEFKAEMDILKEIEDRLKRYNELVLRDRVALDANGNIVIYPPSPAEIKAKRAAKRNEVFKNKHMPGQNSAQKEVDDEFVSSTVLSK